MGFRRSTLVCPLLVLAVLGCRQADQGHGPKPSPAKVESLSKEANLANVTLTPESFKRLGITTAAIQRRTIPQTRILGGDISIPPGQIAVVVAPVVGTVQSSGNGSLPPPGTAVEQGRVVFQLVPLLTPERYVPTPAERAQIANAQATLISLQMAADNDVQQFTEEVAAAKIVLNRAEQLFRDRVGSERAVDDATAQLSIATARLQVATERKQTLDRLTAEVEKGSVSPLPIESPIDGILRSLPVTLGQTVAAGTTLFEVVNLKTVWIRVPIYVGMLDELHLSAAATISGFGEGQKQVAITAEPVKAPPTADPLSSTVDVFYALPNDAGKYRPGERVSVEIPMKTESESLVVPAASILYDIYGGTWVYVKIGDLTFRRARVVVSRSTGELAVLASGPEPGTEVVVDGAAELFGTEFGTGK